MSQPRFAPIPLEDEVRPARHLAPPSGWHPERPGELVPANARELRARAVAVRGRGVPGPDQGYALLLAEAFADRLVLADGEHRDDVLAGAVALALRRAALFGRAPVATDLTVVLTGFGYLAEATAELVARRRERFAGVAHDEWARGALVASLPEATLGLSVPEAVRGAGDWAAPAEP